MSLLSNQPLDLSSGDTYECPHCHCNILTSNEPTHDAICSRRHAGGNQRSAPSNQRAAQPQIIRRESSSSGLPEPSQPTYSNRRPQIREERMSVDNSDKIPCEFCNQAIPMSFYTQHIDDAHRREREEEQERHLQRRQQQLLEEEQSQRHIRERSSERDASGRNEGMPSEDSNPQGMSEEREESPNTNNTQENSGGFMGFLRNLMHSATQQRSEPVSRPQQEERPREVERHLPSEQQSQSNSRSLLSRLVGGHHDHRERTRPATMEDFFLQALQGREESRRESEMQNPFMSHRSQNPFASRPSGSRSMRTIRLGPHGTIVISSGRDAIDDEPEDVWQSVGVPQRRGQAEYSMGPGSMGQMGPMGLLMQLLAARGQGMPVDFNLSPEEMAEIERKGLSKEDIESLSVVKYDAQKNKNLSEDMKSCPICLDEFEDGVEIKFLWCLHRFHKKCIDQWLDKNTNCPICKKDFSEMNEEFAE